MKEYTEAVERGARRLWMGWRGGALALILIAGLLALIVLA